jgi:hypothetical protein
MTDNGSLTGSFHAMGFEGLREAATMVGPNGFGALCMIGLIIWWVYCRNPLPAVMIAAGLICSLTRSAWLGAAIAIPLLAFLMGQKKRFFLYGTLVLALFAAAVPLLGLSDFLLINKTGQDTSAEGHRNEIVSGLRYVAEHPFGSGNKKVSPMSGYEIANPIIFETTYPAIAAAYGIAAALCFAGFLFGTGRLAWQNKSLQGYCGLGILLAMVVIMAFTLPLNDRRLASWALFPIGLAVRSATVSIRRKR